MELVTKAGGQLLYSILEGSGMMWRKQSSRLEKGGTNMPGKENSPGMQSILLQGRSSSSQQTDTRSIPPEQAAHKPSAQLLADVDHWKVRSDWFPLCYDLYRPQYKT